MTRLHIVTIVLNGMPWLPVQFASWQRLRDVDWTWHISHGAAAPKGCTSWCKPIEPQLSTDGTTEFLADLRAHPRVRVYERPLWDGKLPMVNAGMQEVRDGDYVLEADSDELWQPLGVEVALNLLRVENKYDGAEFKCRYFVGPHLVLRGDGLYGNKPGEWRRLWRGYKGFAFTRHEPPETGLPVSYLGWGATEPLGLVFDHYAYATAKQVRFKEQYYGYPGALAGWRRLQALAPEAFPVRARDYLPWITDDVLVERV